MKLTHCAGAGARERRDRSATPRVHTRGERLGARGPWKLSLALCALFATIAITAFAASSCGGEETATWVVVAEFEGLRVEASNPAGPALSPPFDLSAGAVRVAGTLAPDTPWDSAFGLGLCPVDMDVSRPALSIETEHREAEAGRVEEFEGTLQGVKAGEYRLYLLGTPSTCDVTVYQEE